jgi:hypothetical protein
MTEEVRKKFDESCGVQNTLETQVFSIFTCTLGIYKEVGFTKPTSITKIGGQ